MICQDCTEKTADTIIYDTEKKQFFGVCRDCIKKTDAIVPDGLIKEWLVSC